MKEIKKINNCNVVNAWRNFNYLLLSHCLNVVQICYTRCHFGRLWSRLVTEKPLTSWSTCLQEEICAEGGGVGWAKPSAQTLLDETEGGGRSLHDNNKLDVTEGGVFFFCCWVEWFVWVICWCILWCLQSFSEYEKKSQLLLVIIFILEIFFYMSNYWPVLNMNNMKKKKNYCISLQQITTLIKL